MRLIDADAIEKEMCKMIRSKKLVGMGSDFVLGKVLSALYKSPTIDAVSREDYISMMNTVAELQKGIERTIGSDDYAPVRHGKWIEHDDDDVLCECSLCHEKYILYEEHILGRNYCPNCGARMDIERTE